MADTTRKVYERPHVYVPPCHVAATAGLSAGIAKTRPPVERVVAGRHFAGAVA